MQDVLVAKRNNLVGMASFCLDGVNGLFKKKGRFGLEDCTFSVATLVVEPGTFDPSFGKYYVVTTCSILS
jgi:hypothetical protein